VSYQKKVGDGFFPELLSLLSRSGDWVKNNDIWIFSQKIKKQVYNTIANTRQRGKIDIGNVLFVI
jgi:hypothetical protein